jgi:ABC-type cobalamin/Fe3+-siderophores transport system ATPase subunit
MKTTHSSQVATPIVVEGLTKRYGSVTAVDGLSFAVRAGAVTGFLGPNGAGKTTALKMIVGLARATAGRALVNGSPVESSPLMFCEGPGKWPAATMRKQALGSEPESGGLCRAACGS